MSASDFEYLLNKIGPKIAKQDTNMRKCIPAQERLAVTLRFLATGDSYQSLSYLFKFSAQLISSVVPEVCKAIIEVLEHLAKVRIIIFLNTVNVLPLGSQNSRL